jgi:hypothetical protein
LLWFFLKKDLFRRLLVCSSFAHFGWQVLPNPEYDTIRSLGNESASSCLCVIVTRDALADSHSPHYGSSLIMPLVKRYRHPDLHDHLSANGIRASMYASQWFLTLFSSQFHLPMVFQIIGM